MRRADLRSGTSLSTPTRATWTRGSVVTSLPFPSFVTSPIVPVCGDGEICAAYSHIRFEEFPAKLPSGHLDHPANVVGVLYLSGNFGKEFRDFPARQVDGGHDHVRRSFAPELDDPFTQVGLGDFIAFRSR